MEFFCWEELVLSQPLDSTLHCELGELYATLGGVTNFLRARKGWILIQT